MDKMPLPQVLELLKIERECVQRQIRSTIPAESSKCPREWEGTCKGCDLVQSDSDIIQMYDTVIELVDFLAKVAVIELVDFLAKVAEVEADDQH